VEPKITPFQWLNLFANLALVQKITFTRPVIGVLWSLPYEIQMYVIVPAIFLAIKRWSSVIISAILWLAAVMAAAFIQPGISERLDLCQFAPCFLGGIVAFLDRHKSGSLRRARIHRACGAVSLD